ncbi:hypothetical protein, partial [Serratia sp. ME43]|uniref:hypothetical protein n=1 Tax=Serratia sp. ME43 TaxID=2744256 RepID=UPI001C7104A2
MQRPGFSGSVTLREAAGRAQFWWFFIAIFFGSIGLFGLAAAFILRGRPEDVGEYPDGLRPVEVTSMQRPGFSGSVTLR